MPACQPVPFLFPRPFPRSPLLLSFSPSCVLSILLCGHLPSSSTPFLPVLPPGSRVPLVFSAAPALLASLPPSVLALAYPHNCACNGCVRTVRVALLTPLSPFSLLRLRCSALPPSFHLFPLFPSSAVPPPRLAFPVASPATWRSRHCRGFSSPRPSPTTSAMPNLVTSLRGSSPCLPFPPSPVSFRSRSLRFVRLFCACPALLLFSSPVLPPPFFICPAFLSSRHLVLAHCLSCMLPCLPQLCCRPLPAPASRPSRTPFSPRASGCCYRVAGPLCGAFVF